MSELTEWMEKNGVRSFMVTEMELSPGWRVYAHRMDGDDAGITVSKDEPVTDSYILDRLTQQFGSGVTS